MLQFMLGAETGDRHRLPPIRIGVGTLVGLLTLGKALAKSARYP
jgi:hypothetical protein